MTDTGGMYLINAVKESYLILVEKKGFVPYSDDITLEVGDAMELDIALEQVL